MKTLITISFFLVIFTVNCQKLTTKDSTNVLFKAKILTTSEYGISDKEEVIRDIEKQKAVFLQTLYTGFLFIKVDFSQPYRNLNHSTTTLNRICSYYLAFNVMNSRFYKLGGFETVDIDDFFNDLKLIELTIFKGISGNEVEQIDIYCLHKYFESSKKKKHRNNYTCLETCKHVNETKVIIK